MSSLMTNFDFHNSAQLRTLSAELDSAIARRAEAQDRLQRATVAFERGERVAADVGRQAAQAIADEDAALAAQAGALEAWIMAGGVGDAPEVVASEKLSRLRHAAEVSSAGAGRALAALNEGYANAKNDVAAAENAVRAAVKAQIRCQAEAIAAEIRNHERYAVQLRCSLLGLDRVTADHMPLSLFNHLAMWPERVSPGSPFSTPRYADELSQNGPHLETIDAEAQAWRETIGRLFERGAGARPRAAAKVAV